MAAPGWPGWPAWPLVCWPSQPWPSKARPCFTLSPPRNCPKPRRYQQRRAEPGLPLVLGSDGNLYGTTRHGGANGAGSFFRLIPAGGFSNFYSFAPATNGAGKVNYNLRPNGLSQDANGNFYGTTPAAAPISAARFLSFLLPACSPTCTPSPRLPPTPSFSPATSTARRPSARWCRGRRQFLWHDPIRREQRRRHHFPAHSRRWLDQLVFLWQVRRRIRRSPTRPSQTRSRSERTTLFTARLNREDWAMPAHFLNSPWLAVSPKFFRSTAILPATTPSLPMAPWCSEPTAIFMGPALTEARKGAEPFLS